MKKRLRENLTGYLFIAPNLVAYLLLTILPVIFVFYISFTDWDVVSGIGGIRFIGLDNYRELPYDVWFTDSLKNNIRYTVLVVPISLVLSLLVALALNDKIFAPAPVRTMFFVPYVANVVAISAVWMALYHPKYGPINAFLRYLGVNEPPAWLASTKWALPAIMIMNIWGGLGYNAVIYLAGLQTIPRELYEAAEIDGATGFQRLTQITLPMLTPTIFFLLITSIIGAFQLFGQVNLLTQGGPGRATTVLAYYMYLAGFRYFEMGSAASIAIVLFIIVFIITLIQWQAQKRFTDYF